ncbi:MAG: hypothetical protein OXE02_06090 [Chloroflexi bacterium]|nr:hypothetical protein [Chloroflexota bacterium]
MFFEDMEIARNTQAWQEAEEIRRRFNEYHATGEWREHSGWAVDGGTRPPPPPSSLLWVIGEEAGEARLRLNNLTEEAREEYLPQICDQFNTVYAYALMRASTYRYEESTLYHLNGYDDAFYGEILDEHNIYGLGTRLAHWRHWLTTQECRDFVPYEPYPEPTAELTCDDYMSQLEVQPVFLTYFAYPEAWKPMQTGIHRSRWPILCGYLPQSRE